MLNIRPVWKADELKRFGELEEKYHYMGETHSGGDTLRLVIEDGGEWVAIMVWGGACYHLLRRDEYIGWTTRPSSACSGCTRSCRPKAGLRLLRGRQNPSLQRKHHRRDDAGKDSGLCVHGQTRRRQLPGFQGRTPVRSRPATTDGRGCAFKLNRNASLMTVPSSAGI